MRKKTASNMSIKLTPAEALSIEKCRQENGQFKGLFLLCLFAVATF